MKRITFWLAGILSAGFALSVSAVDFAREILPILSNKCFVCHGPDAKKKDILRLDSFEGATRNLGGYSAINSKDLAKSEILVRLHDKEEPMPPKKAEKQLTAEERELLSQWVKEGGKYAKHWAFVPPKKEEISDKGNPIDVFIGAKLKTSGATFAVEADKATLASRCTGIDRITTGTRAIECIFEGQEFASL